MRIYDEEKSSDENILATKWTQYFYKLKNFVPILSAIKKTARVAFFL